MKLGVGTPVGASVKLLRPLDEGGMGAVWVGRHLPSGAEVAVKFMHERLVRQDPTLVDRFQREAAVLGKLQSPQVVRLYESGKLEDGTPYIVMELLEGETLVDRLTREGEPMSVRQVGTLLEQLAAGLDAAHALGIVHRDLKGENIYLLRRKDELAVKLIDFGCAKTPDMPGHPKLTAPGMLVGSPEYMSPEQIIAAPSVDHRSDLWALAVAAYVSLTLSFPFQNEKLSEVLGAIRSGRFEPPSRHRPDLPAAVDAWFQKALLVDRAARFQSAREMSEAFQQAIGGTAVTVPDGNRRVMLISAGVSVALLALAVVLLLIW